MSNSPIIDTFDPSFALVVLSCKFFLSTLWWILISNSANWMVGPEPETYWLVWTVKVVMLLRIWVVDFIVPIARSQLWARGIFAGTFLETWHLNGLTCGGRWVYEGKYLMTLFVFAKSLRYQIYSYCNCVVF